MSLEKTVLDNGITVITETMPDVRSISLGLWYNVGSRDERPDQAGLTHFMEHMMFKGTPTRTAVDISSQFDALGAELNAFTSKEYTCYYTRLVDDKLDRALPIFADMVMNSSFSDDTIEPERKVVLEEIARSEDTPDDHVFDLFTDAMLPTHPLGRPVLGTRELVSSYLHPNCREFHDDHYHAGNLVVSAVGHLDHDDIVAKVQRDLSGMALGEHTERPAVEEAQSKSFAAQKKDTEQAHFVYGFPWMSSFDEDRFAGNLLSAILGGSMSSRLFQEVREKNGLAYAIFSQAIAYRDLGMFCVYCGTRPDNLKKAVDIVRVELEKMVADGPTAEEVERQCEVICGQLLLGLESTSGRMVRLGRTETMGLPHKTIEEYVDIYRALKPADVRAVAEKYLEARPTIAVVSKYSEQEAQEIVE